MSDTLGELQERLAAMPPGPARVDALLDAAEQVFYSDLNEALHINRRAASAALELEYGAGYARSLLQQSYCLHHLARHGDALKILYECLPLFRAESDARGEANALKLMGDVHHETGNVKDALECYRGSVQLAGNLPNRKFLASVLVSLGKACSELENIAEAEGHYHKALDIFREEGHSQGEAVCLNNLGALAQESGDFIRSVAYLDKALNLAEATGFESLRHYTLFLLGLCRFRAGEYAEGQRRLQECLHMARSSGNEVLELDCLLYSAKLELECGRHEQALELHNAARQFARKLNARKREIDLYLLASAIHEGMGNSAEALRLYKEYHELDREIHSAEARRTSTNLRMQMDIEKARREVEINRLKNVELAGALQQLEHANRDLRQLNMEKSEFLSFAAHDLRNPLMAIHNDARSLNAEFDFLDNDDILGISGRVERSARNMLDLITRLLDINRIEMRRLKLDIQNVDWYARLHNALELFRNGAVRKNITLADTSTPGAYLVAADAGALSQICENLISNALKFSPPGSRIEVSLSAATHCIRMAVRDSGPGVSAADLPKLFGKFQQLSAKPTAGEHSSGLGLAIVKKLCDELQGRVWCESDYGKGACFIVELPRAVETKGGADITHPGQT